MKTEKYTWGNRSWEFYRPKLNRKRQFGILGIILATGLLPGPNFVGALITKVILKLNPLFLYK